LPLNSKINSHALNAGDIEMRLLEAGHHITMHSNLYYIWEFWNCLNTEPYRIYHNAEYYHKQLRASDLVFYRDSWTRKFEDPYQRSALFYLFNRYSDNGDFASCELSKYNFSPLNLRSFDRFIQNLDTLDLKLTKEKDLTDDIRTLDDSKVLMIPIGYCSNTFLKPRSSSSPVRYFFNHTALREHIDKKNHKILLVYKYNDYVDSMYDEVIYINKFGKVTNNRELAEDMIVKNF
jgi:hypothetical protein